MKNVERKSFDPRGFLILTSTVAGLGLPITGLANHMLQMEPPISFSRHASMAAHIILGVLFMASTVSHAILNRRILLNYVRGHAARPGITRETLSAIVVVGIMLFFAVSHAFH
ncbi:MAG: hypothetical protein ABFD97_23725 [Syntrophobacter sp.]